MGSDEPAGESPRVLVIEADIEFAELFEQWLADSYTVEVANDPETAYGKFDDSFDVALIDRDLPNSTGGELLQEIRELGLDWRVAMVTEKDPTLEVLEMDFDEYLCKPVSEEQLQRTVSRLTTRSHFEDVATEFGKLVTKKELIETHWERSDLDDMEEYHNLKIRLHEHRENLLKMANSFPGAEFYLEIENTTAAADVE